MPSITTTRLRQLESKERHLHELQELRSMKPFVKQFKQNLATILAHTPMSKWPQAAVTAFQEAERHMPNGAALYKQGLPK